VSAIAVSTSWEARALCRDADAGCFIPPLREESDAERRTRERIAKRVCAGCPVRQECLDYALRVREPFGIWGGLNEVERRALTVPVAPGTGSRV
jgi:WhiB family redox-sensing transcriptional regulator